MRARVTYLKLRHGTKVMRSKASYGFYASTKRFNDFLFETNLKPARHAPSRRPLRTEPEGAAAEAASIFEDLTSPFAAPYKARKESQTRDS